MALELILPKVLVDKIYEYDPTYKSHFKTKDFQNEITRGYFKLKQVLDKAEESIHSYFTGMKEMREYWENGLLVMDDGLWMVDETHFHEWQDDSEVFKVHWMPRDDMLYFKLIKVDGRYEESDGYDGWFERNDNLGIVMSIHG